MRQNYSRVLGSTGVSGNFNCGVEPKLNKNCDFILVTFIGDVMVMTSIK